MVIKFRSGIEALIEGLTKVSQPCECQSNLCCGDRCCDVTTLKETVEKLLGPVQFTDFKVKKSGVHPNEFFLQAYLFVAGEISVERNSGSMIKVGGEVRHGFALNNVAPTTRKITQ